MFEPLLSSLSEIRMANRIGRVVQVGPATLRVAGLSDVASQGDRVALGTGKGEVLVLSRDGITVLPDGPTDGVGIGDPVALIGPPTIAPGNHWIGRIVDPDGLPLDGRPLLAAGRPRALRSPPPRAAVRRRLGDRLATGAAVFDTFLPLVSGQRIGLFAGSGVGKSTLLGALARNVQADVIILALVGERGREVRAFAEDVLGARGLARSVIVAATSDQSPLLRRRCALSAMAAAEFFRDQGAQVLFLCDSVTRFAEAHREVSAAGGEAASLRGWPPSLAHAVMSLAERAGPGEPGAGDITAIFSVLVAGSDMDEPVADILRGVLDGHVILDRRIAERGRFPAIDVLRSVSRSLPYCATDAENGLLAEARQVLSAWDKAELMVQSGLYAAGSDPMVDRAIRLYPKLDAFLSDPSPDGIDAAFTRLAALLS
jgi:flagellum-specific ATP synthase